LLAGKRFGKRENDVHAGIEASRVTGRTFDVQHVADDRGILVRIPANRGWCRRLQTMETPMRTLTAAMAEINKGDPKRRIFGRDFAKAGRMADP
jgi:hypothetical protein